MSAISDNHHLFLTRSNNISLRTLTLAPLVYQQWRRLCVSRFDPRWEKPALVSLIPQVLIQVSICDLLQRLHIIHRHKVTVQVHKLDAHLEKLQRALKHIQ